MSPRITDRPLMKNGRREKLPPANCAAQIEALAADGWSILGIARKLGTSADTFRRWIENPELAEALAQGRENERWALHNTLFKLATEKSNVVAALFLLKARHGYREGDQNETGNKVSITFNLPGALTVEDFSKLKETVIENGTRSDRANLFPTKSLIRT